MRGQFVIRCNDGRRAAPALESGARVQAIVAFGPGEAGSPGRCCPDGTPAPFLPATARSSAALRSFASNGLMSTSAALLRNASATTAGWSLVAMRMNAGEPGTALRAR